MSEEIELSEKLKKLIPIFEEEVTIHSKEIDPSFTQDWFSLLLGWSIAKGLTPEEAWTFSCYVTSYTKLA